MASNSNNHVTNNNNDNKDIMKSSSPESPSTEPSSTGPKPGPPRNVTVTRVAQGYAISWLSPANRTVPVAYYYIEYKISGSSVSGTTNWKTWGPIAKETSYLGN